MEQTAPVWEKFAPITNGFGAEINWPIWIILLLLLVSLGFWWRLIKLLQKSIKLREADQELTKLGFKAPKEKKK